jgi:hypothetical protein
VRALMVGRAAMPHRGLHDAGEPGESRKLTGEWQQEEGDGPACRSVPPHHTPHPVGEGSRLAASRPTPSLTPR